ncbi:hypothetical protein C8J30_105186 [Rhodobacter viridis]|uniref:Uncharacterized protein n=1 Tax=Rhodobacter viridis TaxID=1054202 RepID=A0A318U729_9RHOB|nr:hypothetical protein [Rhodobacter viridis]PYF10376.1 hypothetical protein C8J30_105186 [Rhodobacter viridis]
MTDDTPNRKTAPEATREERLAAALRANLTRRKAQARARSAEGDSNDTAANGPEE